jgi:NAD-dependent DNA ligase
MNKTEAKKRIEELRNQTEYYAKKYYDDDNPEISDFEYDMLMVELRNLEAEFPEYIINILASIFMTISVIATIFSGWNYIKGGKDLFKDC